LVAVAAGSATRIFQASTIEHFLSGAGLAHRQAMLVETSVNRITHEILAAAIEVHRIFGPGLFERVYEPCFHYELGMRNLKIETQRVVPILYKGMRFGATYRVDLIVERLVVVEMKCVTALLPVHSAQVLTYMKLTECPFGLLINFNVPKLMDGVKRLVLPNRQRDRDSEAERPTEGAH
jgi:GxxExxY protein